jgi:hypothetical protein
MTDLHDGDDEADAAAGLAAVKKSLANVVRLPSGRSGT